MYNSYGLDPFRRDPAPNQKHIDFVKRTYPYARYEAYTGYGHIYSPHMEFDIAADTHYGGPSANNAHDAWKFAAEELGYHE